MRLMHGLARDLQISLGPDTGDLDLRVGVHSGPVTAGVLRGERARFQLFGDTMNTTARIEVRSRYRKIFDPSTLSLTHVPSQQLEHRLTPESYMKYLGAPSHLGWCADQKDKRSRLQAIQK